jgi:hypothetical protein
MFNPKVLHPHLNNNIVPMKSGELQPRFIAGGNQVAYYLGLRGNNITAEMPKTDTYSTYEKIIKKHTKK